MYLKLSVAGHLTIFLTRTRGAFWSIKPAKVLWMAVLGTQVIATLIAVYGLFMTPLGWGWAGFVWGYALSWFLLTDRVKLLAYKILDRAKPKTDENKTGEDKTGNGKTQDAKSGVDLTPQIAARAYDLYVKEGRHNGHDVQDWSQAEKDLRQDIPKNKQ
jgi:H+-transporting ATPase